MQAGAVPLAAPLALAAGARVAQAQLGPVDVRLSLNLRYSDPFNPSEGGIWSLVAQTGSTKGIDGISVYLSNIVAGAANSKYGNGVLSTPASGYAALAPNSTPINAASIGAILNSGNPYVTTLGQAVNLLYGQDTASGPIVLNVGRGGGTPNNIAFDPLKDATWNNAALIAQGTFLGGGNAGNMFNRPAFVMSGANTTDANVLPPTATTTPPVNGSLDANTTVFVRGDSYRGLLLEDAGGAVGLRQGDANRDFVVNSADVNLLLANLHQAPGTKSWDQGDFNNDGYVAGGDFALLQNSVNPPASLPPSTATVKFTLTVTPGPKTWTLTATELAGAADNGGIASYGVALSNVDGASVDHNAPRDGSAQGPGGAGAAGFTLLRSLDGEAVILGSQDTPLPTPNLVYGMGQSASSFAANGIVDLSGGSQLESPTWGSSLLLSSGTYSGSGPQGLPQFDLSSPDLFANVFVQASGNATRSGGDPDGGCGRARADMRSPGRSRSAGTLRC